MVKVIKAYFYFSLWEFIQLDFILRVLASNVLNAKFLAFSTSRQTPKTHLHVMSQMSNYFSTCYSTLLLVEGHCSYYYFIHLISLSLSLRDNISLSSLSSFLSLPLLQSPLSILTPPLLRMQPPDILSPVSTETTYLLETSFTLSLL